MADAQARFLTGNLFGHVTRMSLTASVGLMAVFFVDLVDMVFISMLGNAALAAAVGYAGAVLFFTSAFGIGMSITAGALVARALGAGHSDEARRKATHVLIYGTVAATVFAAVVWMNLAPIAALVGAQGETATLAVHYMAIIIPSLPLFVAAMVGGAILRAYGDARRSMIATIIGGLVNAALDPVLIFGFGLDLTGAALASVAARMSMAIAALLPLVRHYSAFSRTNAPAVFGDFKPVVQIAFPAILTQFATPIGMAFVTRTMAQYGEDAVAGMAIVGRLTPVAFASIFALSGAVGPIIGQNAGARNSARVKGAYNAAMVFVISVVIIASALLFALRWPIAALFGATGLTLDLLLLFCGPLALAYVFNGMIFVSNASFNNLGHPFYSTWVNWGRHTIGTMPVVYVFAQWMGAHGVLIGQAVGGAVFAAVAYWLARRVMNDQGDEPATPLFTRRGMDHEIANLRR